MEKREIFVLISISAIIILCLIFISNFTGNIIQETNLFSQSSIIQETDQFSNIDSPHWTHMPLTYSVQDNCNKDKITKAMNLVEQSTNQAVSFNQVESNADITITCQNLDNCYEKKQVRRWFWIITTEAVCEHEAGIAKITKMRANKILKADITLVNIKEKQSNCTDAELHELLHILSYEHSKNNESIMYPEASPECKEYIDKDIADDLIKKYSK